MDEETKKGVIDSSQQSSAPLAEIVPSRRGGGMWDGHSMHEAWGVRGGEVVVVMPFPAARQGYTRGRGTHHVAVPEEQRPHDRGQNLFRK